MRHNKIERDRTQNRLPLLLIALWLSPSSLSRTNNFLRTLSAGVP